MARFRLVSRASLEQLGELVLQIAEQTNGKTSSMTTTIKDQNQQSIQGLVDPSFAPKINLVYDDEDTINIVIPYLDGKVYSGNDLAHEAMGTIVIMGCAS